MDPNNDGDPSDGIDGWRLDVVPDVSKAFWRDWCSYTRTINPDVYLAAEIWEEAQDYMGNDMFNAVMNYPFAFATVNFFIDTNKQITPTEFGDRLSKLLKIYSWDVTLSVMTLTSSHDTDRLANMIKNPDRQYDRKAGPRDSLDYNVTKPTADEQKIQVMIAALQATFPGAPMIYYGDEAGIWGADDPDDRKPMIWEDLNYEDENYSSLGKDYPADKVFFDKDLFKKYQTLFNTRKNYKALQHGDFKIEIMDDTRELFGFSRTYQNETIYIYFNRSHAPHSIPVKSEYNDLLGNQIEKDETGFKLILAAQTASILIPN
jgi:glycosidase